MINDPDRYLELPENWVGSATGPSRPRAPAQIPQTTWRDRIAEWKETLRFRLMRLSLKGTIAVVATGISALLIWAMTFGQNGRYRIEMRERFGVYILLDTRTGRTSLCFVREGCQPWIAPPK